MQIIIHLYLFLFHRSELVVLWSKPVSEFLQFSNGKLYDGTLASFPLYMTYVYLCDIKFRQNCIHSCKLDACIGSNMTQISSITIRTSSSSTMIPINNNNTTTKISNSKWLDCPFRRQNLPDAFDWFNIHLMFMLLFELVTSKTLRINSTRELKPLKSPLRRALLPRTTSNMSLETTVRSRCMSVSHRSSKAAYQNIIPIRSWDVILLVILSAADASRTSTTSALCSWIDSQASISHLFQRRPQQERRMML